MKVLGYFLDFNTLYLFPKLSMFLKLIMKSGNSKTNYATSTMQWMIKSITTLATIKTAPSKNGVSIFYYLDTKTIKLK